MSPRNPAVNAQKRELSKSKILDAAQALFTERGYDATTMADVSRQAGVSAGLTVYYFKTKQHLVQALADRLLHARMVHAARAAAHAGPDDQLAAIIDAVLQTAAEQPQIIAMHLALLLQPGAGSSATGTTRDSAIPTRSVDSRELLSAEDRIFSGLGGPVA